MSEVQIETQPIEAAFTPAPGVLVATDIHKGDRYTDDPTAEFTLSVKEKNCLKELVLIASQSDTTSRRIQVEDVWMQRLFLRGFQHLIPNRKGGWSLPGQGTQWGITATLVDKGIFNINIYAQAESIITAALSADIPRVQFFAKNPDIGPDVTAADAANRYKHCWSKTNNLQERTAETASYFFTDGMAIWYTRSVASTEFGYVTPAIDENPDVPEDELDPVNDVQGDPRIREVTTVYGALESKVPMSAQNTQEMQFLQLYKEVDIATAKALYPWMAKKIQPSDSGVGEIGLDRTARMNCKLALAGSSLAGDSSVRDVTVQKTWLRPSMFMDDMARDCRDSFMTKFPSGVLVECAGTEFACAYPESMDDHLVVMHANPGNGQNRRSLGTNLVPVQQRLNNWADLQNDFFIRTVPNRYYDDEAFDLQAMADQKNVPGASIPFHRQPNVPFNELMGTDPVVQSQPALPDFIKWFSGDLAEQLSGALPSLFGGLENQETVGATVIQRNQALQRLGTSWAAIMRAAACACRQAVQCAADNGNDSYSDVIPSQGRINVEMSDLRGNTLCYPESDSSFPESWSQRESRFATMVQQAPTNPFYQALLSVPKNARAAKDALRMTEMEVPGAASTEKQMAEFEILRKSGPAPNPQFIQLEQELQRAQAGMAQDLATGVPVPPEGQQIIAQLEQTLQSLPPQVSTVPVMDDESEEHVVEAAVCQEWLISAEGRSYKNGDETQRDAWSNVHLHWQQHMAMAKKLAPPTPPPPPKASVTVALDKLPPDEASQILQQYGINSNPASFEQGQTHEVTQEVESPTIGGGKVKQTTAIAGKPLS